MALHLHRSQKIEPLVDNLAALVGGCAPEDPFAAVPVVVGSGGMERWLRHELATRLGVAARLAFLFPSTGFALATRYALASGADGSVDWTVDSRGRSRWDENALALQIPAVLQSLRETPAFAAVNAWLGEPGPATTARELSFAREVAACVVRFHYDRPADALAWARDPAAVDPAYRWLALVLRCLESTLGEPSPAAWLQQLETRRPASQSPPLHVFGLSTLRPGDKRRVAALARHYQLHVYLLAPSSAWISDLRGQSELRRRLREAAGDEQGRELLDALGRDNALLTAHGVPSRDLQGWLETIELHEEPVGPGPVDRPSLLTVLQQWVDAAEENPDEPREDWLQALDSEESPLASVEIHRAHGSLRQCELVRQALLRRMQADPTLEPRHILVMTPDLATYGPLMSAVLERQPALPVQMRDTGLRANNPVADALLRVLMLASERVTARALLALLDLPPVAARFGLDASDLPRLREEVAAAGLAWGWDAQDRAGHGQPPVDQNSIRFGLERLALGRLMATDDDMSVVDYSPSSDPEYDRYDTEEDEGRRGPNSAPAVDMFSVDAELTPAAPAAGASAESGRRFGAFARLCEVLRQQAEVLTRPRAAAQWRRDLSRTLDAVTAVAGRETWQRSQVEQLLEEWLPATENNVPPLRLDAVRQLLQDVLDRPQRQAAAPNGAVQLSGLEPMRSLPFRVVVLVGLDDGAFPRSGALPTWDPFARPRAGEYDRAAVDRHLFLEALLCARDTLLLVGRGFEGRRGSALPLSSVVEELQELLTRGLGKRPVQRLLHQHPLQPWSPAAFDHSMVPLGDPAWFRGEVAAASVAGCTYRGPERDDGGSWPPAGEEISALSVSTLARALAHPPRELLQHRLGLQQDQRRTALADREPLELDFLDEWSVRGRMLRAAQQGRLEQPVRNNVQTVKAATGSDRLRRRLAAEGALPPLAAGAERYATWVEEALAVVQAARALGPAAPGAIDMLSVRTGGLLLSVDPYQSVQTTGGECGVWLTASSQPNDALLLTAWATMLAGNVAAEHICMPSVYAVGRQRLWRLTAPDLEHSRRLLDELVLSWRTVRAGPSWLLPRFSRMLALALHKGKPVAEAVEALADLWRGGPQQQGLVDDPWVEALLGRCGWDVLASRAGDALVREAQQVWGPLMAFAEDKAVQS